MQFTHPAGISPYPYIYISLFSVGLIITTTKKLPIDLKSIEILLFILVFGLGAQFTSGLAAFGEILIFILAVLCAFVFATVLVPFQPDKFFWSVEIFLWIASIALYSQFFLNIVGLGYIDVHNLFFPWSYGKGSELSFGVTRYTGLFQEPGQHSTVVAALLLISVLSAEKLKAIHFVALLSCALAFATIGLVYFACISALVFVRFAKLRLSTLLAIGTTLPVGIYAVWTFGAETYIRLRFIERQDDASLNVRLENYQSWMEWNFWEKVFGRGLEAYLSPEFTSLQGSGLLFSSTVCFGVLWFPLLFISSILLNRKRPNLISLMVIFGFLSISRFPPTFMLPYFLMFVAAMRPRVAP